MALDQPIIQDPASKEYYSRDLSVPGSLYQRYVGTPPTVPATDGGATQPPGWHDPIRATPAAGASSTGKTPLEQAQDDYYSNLTTTVDPEAIRENVRKSMQSQIDATDTLYQGLVADQGVANSKQYDRVRGLNVNAGLAGSDFASANAAEAEKGGNDAIAAIKREQAAKVGVILGNIDQRAYDEIKAQTDQARTNAKDKVDFMQGRATAAQADIKTLASSNVPLDSLQPDQYSKLLKQSGYDDFTFKMVYNAARNAASKVDYTWKVAGNKIFGYGIDPLTQKISTVETDVPGGIPSDYHPTVLDNGTILFYPDTLDPTKPVKDQILTYNTGVVKDKRTEGQKNDSAAAARLAPATEALGSLRDPNSGYVDPKAYSDMYATYVQQNPGHGKEFLDQHPVSIYIAPEARSAFSTTGY